MNMFKNIITEHLNKLYERYTFYIHIKNNYSQNYVKCIKMVFKQAKAALCTLLLLQTFKNYI